MESEEGWMLPSESRRVRTLLYFLEGLLFGAGGLLLMSLMSVYLVNIETGSFNLQLTPFGAFMLLSLLYLAGRGLAFIQVSSPSQEKSSELQDWSDTRKWRWVFVVALLVSGVLFGVAVALWSWWHIVFTQRFDLLLLTMMLAGILLYVYILYMIER